MTCNASSHTLPSRKPLGGTHFRLPTKLRHHSPTLGSLGSPFSIHPPNQGRDIHHRLFLLPQLRAWQRTLLEDISREKGGADVGIEEGDEVWLPSIVAGSF